MPSPAPPPGADVPPGCGPSPSILFVSNGHGEDVVAARIAAAVHAVRPDATLHAFATVGDGAAYDGLDVRRLGPALRVPSGGFTFEHPSLLARDLRAGLVSTSLHQMRVLRGLAVDRVVAVGDVWAAGLGALPRAARRHAVQTLVSAYTEAGGARLGVRAFRDRFTGLERALLARAYAAVHPRDAASEVRLRAAGLPARALGNPMMDGLDVAPDPDLDVAGDATDAPVARVALLPGTRGQAPDALARMVEALVRLPDVHGAVAWAAGPFPAPPTGWSVDVRGDDRVVWRRGDVAVPLVRGRFASVLAWADLALGTSGTAQEQAAGRGRPVVAFATDARYPASFLAKQRRLLGDALEVVPSAPAAIAAAVAALAHDPRERARRGAVGRERMGAPGGAARIADAVVSDLAPPRSPGGAHDGGRDARISR
ncbi:MAG: lipid-A-disaccharide synthase-related protein [Trueperaceae bacterium]|nr:lipid-A-disaccharide synthase-related protein [Trueperaceae bacterium]